ncbi:hypothetical protein Forpe1208_v016802 [Fusarium oxysporum f. sp. rapae]|uniref:HTH CENPB-type domain-containing protein n=1 Tax=Fusarium oxysporum f. sp. rapae TaxID=485398 RepID=A0A8J5TMM3_FUSOX|nr:hypothetical protein Forpe1208_v016802 [Fusarium oxysporum f. sp. rapae]
MPLDANVRAAQAVVSSRQRLQKGLSRDAANVMRKPLLIRDAERQYKGSHKSSIARIVKKLEEAKTADFSLVPEPNKGRPRLLSDAEEEAIVCFIIWMQKSGLPASKCEIEDAANTIRSRRDAAAQPVSRMWYRRFRDDHPELDTSILKSKEAARYEYEEAGVEETKQWFKRLSEVITRYRIGASECWNADQAGIRVGILRERVQCLVEIFEEGFTAAHIISGFEKSGIFPPTEAPAVSYLLKKKLKTRQAIDPALSSLLPAENRFPMASDTARDVGNRYHDILSSPTRRGLEAIQKIISEAVVLEDIVKKHVADRQQRIEKRYHQRKRGKRGRPVGDYFHNVSLEELREQQAEFIEVGAKAEQRSQLRNIRSFVIRQMEEIKAEWQQKKEVIVDGVEKKMRFKQWLEHTKRDVEYASLDASRAEISSQLKKKEDCFMIDTQLAPEAREAIRNAGFAANPLSAADLSGLLNSDDSVDFQLTQPPADADFNEGDSLIDLSEEEEVAMPSSPPYLPDYESPLPTVPSTPCPVQHQAQFRDALISLIEEERSAIGASHRPREGQESTQFNRESVINRQASLPPLQLFPSYSYSQ